MVRLVTVEVEAHLKDHLKRYVYLSVASHAIVICLACGTELTVQTLGHCTWRTRHPIFTPTVRPIDLYEPSVAHIYRSAPVGLVKGIPPYRIPPIQSRCPTRSLLRLVKVYI